MRPHTLRLWILRNQPLMKSTRQLSEICLAEASAAPANRSAAPNLKFFATDSAEKFMKMGSRFLDFRSKTSMHVDLKE